MYLIYFHLNVNLIETFTIVEGKIKLMFPSIFNNE